MLIVWCLFFYGHNIAEQKPKRKKIKLKILFFILWRRLCDGSNMSKLVYKNSYWWIYLNNVPILVRSHEKDGEQIKTLNENNRHDLKQETGHLFRTSQFTSDSHLYNFRCARMCVLGLSLSDKVYRAVSPYAKQYLYLFLTCDEKCVMNSRGCRQEKHMPPNHTPEAGFHPKMLFLFIWQVWKGNLYFKVHHFAQRQVTIRPIEENGPRIVEW